MQTMFFVQLNSSETRKVLERAVNYVFYKVIGSLKIFLSIILQLVYTSKWSLTKMILHCGLNMTHVSNIIFWP